MHLGWSRAVLVICVVVSVICIVLGAIRAALAARAVRLHAERLRAMPLLADVAEANAYFERINADIAAIDGELTRAKAAIASIDASLHELRIPEAVAAVRLAGASIRLLFSGR